MKEEFDDDGSTNIRVCAKIRPPNQRELALAGGVVVQVPTDQQVVVGDKPPFSFDFAFPMDITQLKVFEQIGVDIVKCSFNGYNASMFAYGQTSSGAWGFSSS